MIQRNLVRSYSLAALGAASLLPLAFACGGGNKPADNPTAASGSVAFGQPPAGQYPGQPYPGQQVPNQQYPGAQQPYPQQPPYGGQPQQTYPGAQPAGTYPGAQPGAQPAPSGSQGPLGNVVTTDPNALAALFAQAAAAGQAMLQQPGAVPGDPIELGIKATAARFAPGMQPEGQMAKGQLQEGGHLTFLVPMQAGKCYTVIGFSPPGQVKNLDLNLLAPPFYNMLAGQDTTDNNTPVVGKGNQPMCPIVPIAVQYKIDIVARSGAGNVGAQVYSKSK